MPSQPFEFLAYRLNRVEEPALLQGAFSHNLATDEDIVSVLKAATASDFDVTRRARTAVYRWSLRDFDLYDGAADNTALVAVVDLARSTLVKDGRIVTDNGIVEGDSQSEPPLASVMRMVFYLKRHLVAVEYNSQLMVSTAWLDIFSEMISKAASVKGYGSWFELEPIPTESEVINAFKSFEKLTRLRVHLRLPNPDLSRYTRHLYEELRDGGIRDYVQDMRSFSGLSQDEAQLPFASAAMAQGGYKKGEVRMEGISAGKFRKVTTGKQAARGTIDALRDFVRGIRISVRTREATEVVAAIERELRRIAPVEREGD